MPSCTNLNLDAFESTREAVADDASAGRGTFSTTTRWEDGAKAQTSARSFDIDTDEPASLGGTDEAVDPMELLLASLGTCLTIGWVTQAARRDIDFDDLTINVEGDYDLRGYLDVDDQVRPGFTNIRYTVSVDSDAPEETLEELRRAAEDGSPMFDNIVNGAPVEASLVTG